MKILLNTAFLFIIITAVSLYSQDWAKVNPEMNKILADTTLLRATIAIIEPGMKSEVHTHAANFSYVLTDGKIRVYYTDGQIETLELKAGDYIYGDPEKPHQTENIGPGTIRFLMVELKEHPYISGK